MAKKYSRLTKRLESQSKKNLLLSIVGITIIGFFMFRFGVPLLASFTGFISNFNNSDESTETEPSVFIPPPVLDPLRNAVDDSEIEITGQALDNQEVSIYLNDALVEKTKTQKNGTFSFNLFLRPGENRIKVKAHEKNKESNFSDEKVIIYFNEPPKLEIQFPTDGQKFEKEQRSISVYGQTDENIRVTINDFWAVMEGEKFSYNLSLKDGENEIKIVAQDSAGNKSEKSIKVTYSP